MSDATVVAIVILFVVLVIMIAAIMKAGVEGAIRIWSVMGALTGVAFGSITSFYFTNQVNQKQIAQLQAENETVTLALSNASLKLQELEALKDKVQDVNE